eukprot:83838_1
MDKFQKHVKEIIHYPLFSRHDLVSWLLTNSNMQSQQVIQLFLERPKNSKEYKNGELTIKTYVFIVDRLDEALSMNVKNNIDGGLWNRPSGLPKDNIYWTLHGDTGKGKTSISISTFTREHPN